MLEFNNISVSVSDKKLFDAEKFQIGIGVCALVGRNGSGKSTFLKTILGEYLLSKGEIKLHGKSISALSPVERAKLISVVYSRSDVFGDLTVEDVLMLGRIPYQNFLSVRSSNDEKQIHQIAHLLGIENWLKKSINNLSDGEKQKVMIGRALVQDTPILLMDEPSAFLDVVNRVELSKLLYKLAHESQKIIITSTHQLDQMETEYDQVLLIADQKMKVLKNKSTFKFEIYNSFGIQ